MSERKIIIAAAATFAVAFTVAYKRPSRKAQHKAEVQAEIAKINLATSRVIERINAGEIHSISQLITEMQFEKIVANQE